MRRAASRPAAGQEAPTGSAARIRARRRGAGLSQQELADSVSVSRQTVVSMESGEYAPSVYLALRIARTLQTTVEALWEDPRNPNAQTDAAPARDQG